MVGGGEGLGLGGRGGWQGDSGPRAKGGGKGGFCPRPPVSLLPLSLLPSSLDIGLPRVH